VATLRHAAIPLRAVTRRPTAHRRREATLLHTLPVAVALMAVAVALMAVAVALIAVAVALIAVAAAHMVAAADPTVAAIAE